MFYFEILRRGEDMKSKMSLTCTVIWTPLVSTQRAGIAQTLRVAKNTFHVELPARLEFSVCQ